MPDTPKSYRIDPEPGFPAITIAKSHPDIYIHINRIGYYITKSQALALGNALIALSNQKQTTCPKK